MTSDKRVETPDGGVNLNKVRGLSQDIVVAIGASPTTTTTFTQIKMVTGFNGDNRILQRYLHRLILYGLVVRVKRGLYSLTDAGKEYYTILYNNNNNNNINNKLDRSKTEVRQIVRQKHSNLRIDQLDRSSLELDRSKTQHVQNTVKPKELSLNQWLVEESPSEAEVVVVDALVANYNRSGRRGTPRKYLEYSDLVSVGFSRNLNSDDLIVALKSLDKAGKIYHYPHGAIRENTKIGLMVDFVRWLHENSST